MLERQQVVLLTITDSVTVLSHPLISFPSIRFDWINYYFIIAVLQVLTSCWSTHMYARTHAQRHRNIESKAKLDRAETKSNLCSSWSQPCLHGKADST